MVMLSAAASSRLASRSGLERGSLDRRDSLFDGALESFEVDFFDRCDGADLLEDAPVRGAGLGEGGNALGRAISGDHDVGWGRLPVDGCDGRGAAAAAAAADSDIAFQYARD